ncbi:ABC transporter permease [Pontibacter russatus]|uniref:ABC transporter permease n=1 Tax=Pontibacter russatus TaxID=2694929 RepID=UPI00137993F1|nr:ABC transporter permease [Pontibacter russatus]
MLQNYFKIAIRNLIRNKVYSAINIVGLAIGVASCVLIFLYVQDELSYESHFSKADRIVRLAGEVKFESQETNKFALSPAALEPALRREFPEIDNVTQLLPARTQTVWYKDKSFNEKDMVFADSSFFQVFDYELLAGDPNTVLDEPLTMVVSEDMAEKYFGAVENAPGELLKVGNVSYNITGVYRDPKHSHIEASAFLSRSAYDASLDEDTRTNQWFALNRYTYALLQNPEQLPAFKEKLDAFTASTVTPWIKENDLNATMTFVLQPLKSIHFDTEYGADISPAGNISYVYIFAAVAVFILLIACINYMNLATARSARRAKEVGLRKVVGAYRSQIIRQFIGESVLITLIAVVLALGIVQMMIPTFNALTDKNFSSGFIFQWEFLLVVLAIVVFVGGVAGSYPAFFLSGFKPIDVLKSEKAPKSGSVSLRRVLVVAQFTISLILIIGTIVVFTQMHYLRSRDLGFNKEQVMVIDIPNSDSTLVQRLPTLKHQLLRNPNVEMVSNTNDIPAESLSKLMTLSEVDGKMVERALNVMFVDYDFLDALGIEMKEGRNYSRDMKTDLKGGLIINEAAAKWLGWSEPVGKRMQMADWDARVIGVVNDFHVKSLHTEVEPLILALRPSSAGYLLARIKAQEMPATISFVESQWRNFDSKHPMEYFFLDEHFDEQYRAEEKMLTVFGYFAGLTILIACLGLFGLASFTAEQRTKEIGIRKVLGSSTGGIVLLLSKDFALLVLVAIVLASPVAWYGMRTWLQDFAYRTELSWWIFVVAGAAAMAIALLTVSLQAMKAALTDPVKSLRTQ